MQQESILEVSDVRVCFGGIVALDGVSFDVPGGAIVGLIGPNGAGKTTLFNCLSRVYTPQTGSIRLEGSSLLGVPAHGIAALGIGRTFQNLALFGKLSVLDNVRIGAHSRYAGGMLGDILRLGRNRRNERAIGHKAEEVIEDLGLGLVADRLVADLPFGTQKRVEMARALAMEPKLLLLDEPACGLNHSEVEEFKALIQRIRAERPIAVLMVEHHMELVMSTCDYVVALNFGRRIAKGTPDQVRQDPAVIEAYLGAAH